MLPLLAMLLDRDFLGDSPFALPIILVRMGLKPNWEIFRMTSAKAVVFEAGLKATSTSVYDIPGITPFIGNILISG